MNKKIKAYLFLVLTHCSARIQSNQASPSAPLLSLGGLQTIICEHPKISLMIAAIISLFGYKKLLSSSKNNASGQNTNPTVEIVAANNKTSLLLTPPHKKEPYCFTNIHNYSISPQGNFLLIRQLQDTSVISAIGKTIWNKLDILTTIQTLLRCSALHHIVDIKTGTVILTLKNIQQCCFSSNEKYVLVRELTPKGIISSLLGYFTKTTQPLPQKDISGIQYKIIDLTTKKTIATFNNIHSARFVSDDTLEVINSSLEKQYFAPEAWYSLNPFSAKVHFQETDYTSEDAQEPPIISFYFDIVREAYCLDIHISDKEPVTIPYVKAYTQHKHYLLVDTDETEHTQLEALRNQISIGSSFPETMRKMLALIKKPQFVAQLVNLTNGEYLNNFKYKNPILCTVTPQNTFVITELCSPNNTIVYKNFNLTDNKALAYQNGKYLTFDEEGTFSVEDENKNPCETKQKDILQQISSEAQDFFDSIQATFTRQPQETIPATPTQTTTLVKIDESTTYANYMFKCQQPSTSTIIKVNFQDLLNNRTFGFHWNIHLFTPDKFSVFSWNSLDGYDNDNKKNHICISNCHPKEMKYTQYQSLTNELNNVISFMNQNHNAIISIILTKNDCTDDIITKEITSVPNATNFLLKPTDLEGTTVSDQKITEMIQNNKRLLLFSSDQNSDVTFPLSSLENGHPLNNTIAYLK